MSVDETAEPTPIHADGSQLRAIELAAQGQTFVLEGPPGTGKSQTITNLIARNLAAGRSVLFVAEKQAALEVVKKRLDRIGLKPFTLDLHGRNQSVVEVRNQLRESIEYRADYNERVWDARIAEFRSKHLPLAEYPARVHSRNVLGDSLWTTFETVLSLGGERTRKSPTHTRQRRHPSSSPQIEMQCGSSVVLSAREIADPATLGIWHTNPEMTKRFDMPASTWTRHLSRCARMQPHSTC